MNCILVGLLHKPPSAERFLLIFLESVLHTLKSDPKRIEFAYIHSSEFCMTIITPGSYSPNFHAKILLTKPDVLPHKGHATRPQFSTLKTLCFLGPLYPQLLKKKTSASDHHTEKEVISLQYQPYLSQQKQKKCSWQSTSQPPQH